MNLLTKPIEAKLRKNFLALKKDGQKPALKLFNPVGGATWLLTELDDEDNLFGLCDLGMGCPELGYVSLAELQNFRGRMGLGIERDRWFKANKTLADYAEEARQKERIVA